MRQQWQPTKMGQPRFVLAGHSDYLWIGFTIVAFPVCWLARIASWDFQP